MNILLVHNYYQYPGGEDLVFESEGRLLEENGHHVRFLKFRNTSIRGKIGKLRAAIFCLYNPKSKALLNDAIKQTWPDVIHIHNIFPLASPSILFLAKRYNIPVVITLHNYRMICPSATLYHDGKLYLKSIKKTFPIDAIIKKVYRNSVFQTAMCVTFYGIHKILGTWHKKVDRYITLTNFAHNLFQSSSLKVPESKFVVKSNFVFDPGESTLERADFFLFIGRLSQEKGIQCLLDLAKMKVCSIKICGTGPMEEVVRSVAVELENLEYLGQLDRSEVLGELKKSKALIFPSVWYEGMPMVIIEALATGTPVICTNLGGQNEMINHGINGLKFEADNYLEFLSCIKLIEGMDDKDYFSLSRNARKTYEEQFSAPANYKALVKIYNSVISKNG